MATDIFGKALLDFQKGEYTEDIHTSSSMDEEDKIPLPYLFRDFDAMPKIEQKALQQCQGTILDIGAGAGSHSLYLQEKNVAVTALDSSLGAIKTCRLRGLKNTVHDTIENYKGQKYDTLLLLMNGIGLAGTLENLPSFLSHLKTLLNPDGQIVLDSSDIIYMYDTDEDGGYWIPDSDNYYGEVTFTMSYKGDTSTPFPWLYLDFNTLARVCSAQQLTCELLGEGEHFDYLARIRMR